MKPFALFDAPVIFDCSVTPIPASNASAVQVVASLASRARRIEIIDAVGEYFGIYEGAPGQEVLIWVVGNRNETSLVVDIPQGSRISLRSMTTAAINTGTLCCTFFGN